MGIDLERVAAKAVYSFLHGDGDAARDGTPERDRHRLAGAGSVAVGLAIGIAARTAYRRARDLDLEEVAGTVQEKLQG